MRFTVLRLSPDSAASERVLQCVASLGVDSNVIVSTRSISASLTLRGVPGRGSSNNPSNRRSTKRCRHLQTVWILTRNFPAAAVFVLPSAHSRIMRARSAKACADFGRRAQFCKASRSPSVTTSGGMGRPVRISVLLLYKRRNSGTNCYADFRDGTLVSCGRSLDDYL